MMDAFGDFFGTKDSYYDNPYACPSGEQQPPTAYASEAPAYYGGGHRESCYDNPYSNDTYGASGSSDPGYSSKGFGSVGKGGGYGKGDSDYSGSADYYYGSSSKDYYGKYGGKDYGGGKDYSGGKDGWWSKDSGKDVGTKDWSSSDWKGYSSSWNDEHYGSTTATELDWNSTQKSTSHPSTMGDTANSARGAASVGAGDSNILDMINNRTSTDAKQVLTIPFCREPDEPHSNCNSNNGHSGVINISPPGKDNDDLNDNPQILRDDDMVLPRPQENMGYKDAINIPAGSVEKKNAAKKAVTKRPFLKRGARNPLSTKQDFLKDAAKADAGQNVRGESNAHIPRNSSAPVAADAGASTVDESKKTRSAKKEQVSSPISQGEGSSGGNHASVANLPNSTGSVRETRKSIAQRNFYAQKYGPGSKYDRISQNKADDQFEPNGSQSNRNYVDGALDDEFDDDFGGPSEHNRVDNAAASSDGENLDEADAPVSKLVQQHFYKAAKKKPKRKPVNNFNSTETFNYVVEKPQKNNYVQDPEEAEEYGGAEQYAGSYSAIHGSATAYGADNIDHETQSLRDDLGRKLKLLDAQISRFKRENEQCKKLRLERDAMLKQTEQEKERVAEQLQREREALHAEIDEEREKLRKEKARVNTEREKHRLAVQTTKADVSTNESLAKQLKELKEDMQAREVRYRRTIERLQRQNEELIRKNQEYSEELSWANRKIEDQNAQLVHKQEAQQHASQHSSQQNASPVVGLGDNVGIPGENLNQTAPNVPKISTSGSVSVNSVTNPLSTTIANPLQASSLQNTVKVSTPSANSGNREFIASTPTAFMNMQAGKRLLQQPSSIGVKTNFLNMTGSYNHPPQTNLQPQISATSLGHKVSAANILQATSGQRSGFGSAVQSGSELSGSNASNNVSAGYNAKSVTTNTTANSKTTSSSSSMSLADEIVASLPVIDNSNVDKNEIPLEKQSTDGRIERIFKDGRREIMFTNGLKKILWPDSRCTVLFTNGDTKDCLQDGTVVYRYATTSATQTTFATGIEVFQFASGQIERHFPNGEKEIKFANGTTKKIYASGKEEIRFPDGNIKLVSPKKQ